jgi:methionyl aminopeptidase
MKKRMAIMLKSRQEIEKMRRSGQAVRLVLDMLQPLIKPGATTMDLEVAAERKIAEMGGVPAFKGYHGYPCVLCTSVNSEVVHGIPSKSRILRDGDIVSVDCGVLLDGYFGDSARTFAVGDRVQPKARKLLEVTEASLERAIGEVKVGATLGDIGAAVQEHVEAVGFNVVRDFVGHGIGRQMHEDPQIPNYGHRGRGTVLKAGMVLAIEPMVNTGAADVKVLEDGWTAVTVDGSLSAHFEHTVAVTEDGPLVLTR